MRGAIIAFTRSGCAYAGRIEKEFQKKGWEWKAFGKCACAEECGVKPLKEPLKEWTGRQFACCDVLLFVGATGIAVRSIAPFVTSKLKDPAVLCMDEQAKFVISLLSGHVGGANELALEVASLLGAVPVITTATDLHEKFAVDVFAKKGNMVFLEKKLAKEVSAAVLENKTVGLYSDFEITGKIPPELSYSPSVSEKKEEREERGELGICISLDDTCQPFSRTLHLVPRIAVLGMGCRKGASKEAVRALAEEALALNRISRSGIRAIASIDLKKEEPGLLALAQEWGVEFVTYSAEELAAVEYEGAMQESDFVKQITGVGNVCERAALLALRGQKPVLADGAVLFDGAVLADRKPVLGSGRLLQAKLKKDGVTAAIACGEFQVAFP